jgi:curved DNA-binding protein CbpA
MTAPNMTFREHSFAEILMDLYRQHTTGLLKVDNPPISKRIYVRDGFIVSAMSNQEEDTLKEILLQSGKITVDQYFQAAAMSKSNGRPHETVLIELGYLKLIDLIWSAKKQVDRIIMSLFHWDDGTALITENTVPLQGALTLKLNIPDFVYRGIKKITSTSYLQNTCNPMDTVLRYRIDPKTLFQDVGMDEEDEAVLSLIDGTRKVSDIVSASSANELQTMKAICAFLITGIVDRKEKEEADPETYVPRDVVRKIEDIFNTYEKIGFYGILGINEKSTQDEIKKAYYRAVKEFHPDEHPNLKSSELRDKLHAIFTFVTRAYKTLSDPEKKMEYDSAQISQTERTSTGPERAKAKFQEAVNTFKKGNYPEAADLFKQAAFLDSSVSKHHYFHGIALKKLGKLKDAGWNIQKALGIDPANAGYMAELGHIFLQLGFHLRAKGLFERAAGIDPRNERAAEGLKQISELKDLK